MININFLHTIIDEVTDDNFFKKINRDDFFSLINKAEIDLDKIVTKRKKNDLESFHRFNFILKDLHEKQNIDMTEACLYIMELMLPLKDLISCLNDENRYILRTSLAERNNIPLKKSSLTCHMYKRKRKVHKTINSKI